MTFIFNYKGKNFTEEEIVQRINAGISTESEKKYSFVDYEFKQHSIEYPQTSIA